jgi:hypothetical protein
MKPIWRATAVGLALTSVLAATSGTIKASPVNRTTYLTFSRSVALPGVTLAAGTYIFELPADDRSIVRVSSRDRLRVFFTAFTKIVDRPRGVKADQPVTLGEAPRGEAQPIRAWYLSGEESGREFIYRK